MVFNGETTIGFQQQYRILIPAWGKKYVNRALDYCLSSLMSPGNIPTLKEKGEVYIVFLTQKESKIHYENNGVFKSIPDWIRIEFIWIDDIIILENYGVTLTCAYARAIIQAQKIDNTNPIFIFANADFVFSNGSLLRVEEIINNGNNGITCPSVRCVEMDIISDIEKYRGDNRELSVSCQSLMRMTYDAPHITDIASHYESNVISHSEINHYFIGNREEKKLLGVWFLRFMLAIRPVNKFDYVRCFCDYSFMSQMVSDQSIYQVTDGHDIFILELSDRYQESGYVQLGKQKAEDIVKSVERFSTAHHRENGLYPYWLDLDPDPESRKNLMKMFEETSLKIKSLYSNSPHDWRNHHFWSGAIQSLKQNRFDFPEDLFHNESLKPYSSKSKTNLRGGIGFLLNKVLNNLSFFYKNLLKKILTKYASDLTDVIKCNDDIVIVSRYVVCEYIENIYGTKVRHIKDRLQLSKCHDIDKETLVVYVGDIDDFFTFIEDFPIGNGNKIICYIVTKKSFSGKGFSHIERIVDIEKYFKGDCEFEFPGKSMSKIGMMEQFLSFYYWRSGFSYITRLLLFLIFCIDVTLSDIFNRRETWSIVKITCTLHNNYKY